jgi:ABC-2 type transport system permease protein
LWDRQFGFLKETLVAPVPRIMVMVGNVLGGATVAIFQGVLVLIICLIFGFRPTNWYSLPLALLFMVLTAIVFSGLGMAIGSVLQDIKGMQLVMNFLVLPIFFLSGALYPLEGLPTILSFITRLDPLSYGIDGLRGALISTSQLGVSLDLAILSAFAVVFLIIGGWLFSKIQI